MLQDKTIDLKNRVIKFLNEHMPITAGNKSVYLEDIAITDPPELHSIESQLKMQYLTDEEKKHGKGSLTGKVSCKIVVKNNETGEKSTSPAIKDLFSIPYLTKRSSYMIKGGEKIILNQMTIKPGVYTAKTAEGNTAKTTILFDNKAGGGKYTPVMDMTYSPDTSEFKINVKGGKESSYNGIGFLRELGYSDPEIAKMMGNANHADAVFEKTGSRKNKPMSDIYKAITGDNYGAAGASSELLREKLFNYTAENAKFGTGTNVVRDNLGIDSDHLSKDVLKKAVENTFAVAIGSRKSDDKDDLRYQDVATDNDFIMREIEKDFLTFKKNVTDVLSANPKATYKEVRAAARSLGYSLDSFMSGSSANKASSGILMAPEQINPLFVAANRNKITQLGTGGIFSSSIESNARNLAKNSFGRIDPIETPESGNIGVVQHISQSAKIKNGTIYAPVLKVKDGKTIDDESNVVELSPDEDYEAKIAFYDTKNIKRSGNKISFLTDEVPARYHGKNVTLPVSEIQYLDHKPQDIMGFASNAIPFVAHDDGNRALMGANMQKQAITLKNREQALVSSAYTHDKSVTYDDILGEHFGQPVRSNVDGIVHDVNTAAVTVKDGDGNLHKHEYYHYFPFNQSFINNDVKVKPGDVVKKGDTLAEGWQTKDGKLALGVNTRIAYMPYKGHNYEDGVVISDSYAQKMSTEEMGEEEINVPDSCLGGRGSDIQGDLKKYTTRGEVFTKLDKDGIIKVGEKIHPGSILVSMLKDIKSNPDDPLDLIRAKKKDATAFKHVPYTIPKTSYTEGTVVRVNIINNPEAGVKQKIIITYTNSKPLNLGDKIAGRHGNKGTITRILSDEEMPVAEDGKAIDLMFSPLAIPSRKNIGQVLEAHAGLVAEKTGKPFVVSNFDHSEKDRVIQGLKDIGIPNGKMKVFLKEKQDDGTIKSVETENPVTIGNMYIIKLKHKVDDKIQSRSNLETFVSPKTNTPAKTVGEKQGEKHNPQSLGEMEMRALQAHGAVWNILENSTFKSDGGGDKKTRAAIFNALATGKFDSLDMPATPETLKVLIDNLRGLGLKVTPMYGDKEAKSLDDPFDGLKILPIKPTEVVKMIGKENVVTDHNIFDSKDESTKDQIRKGSLFDPKIFGEDRDADSRKKWGYIKLVTPVANPMFLKTGSGNGYNPYSAATGLGSKELASIAEGKKVIIVDPEKYTGLDAVMTKEDKKACLESMKKAGYVPGQLVDPLVLEKSINDFGPILWKAGGEAIQHLLDNVDLDERIDKVKKDLDKAKGGEIHKQYKQYKQLLSLKDNNIKPSELMIHNLPVLPAHLRPIVKDATGITKDDLNTLYQNIIYKSNTMAKTYGDGMNMMLYSTPANAAAQSASLFKKVTDLTGHTQGKDRRTKRELQGIKSAIAEKEGLIRGQMLSKRVDFSGRSVIGVDPTLKMNEVGLPIDMAKYLYKPFILKGLYEQGKAKSMEEAKSKWENLDADTVKVIHDVAGDRPVMINRQPTLHKFGVQAFKPVILAKSKDGKTVRSMQLNPLVVTGFNADFDGDTMAAHVPITERAKEEAKKIMMPSQNLINPTNGSIVAEIRHEMALGVYYLTMDSAEPKGEMMKYSNYDKLKKDFLDGVIRASQNVSIAGKSNITAGSALYNLLIPEKYRDFKKIWTSKDIQKMFKKMYQDAEADNGISKMEISNYMDKIKDIGFEAATKSGVSLGINDFKKVDFSGIIDKSIKEMSKKESDPEKALILGYQEAEGKIQKELSSGVLSKDNPLQIMMVSGARAKPDQIRRMMVTVGIGRDLNQQLTKPVLSSHLDGLSPQEYWLHAHDSRKGMADRSVSTQAPGEITRNVWSAVQDVIINADDCGTTDGIELNSTDNALLGRFTAKNSPIIGENGTVYCAGNQMITDDIRNRISKDNLIRKVKVRSPLRCKTVGGVCQKCYGAIPGTTQVPKLGAAIGVLASQALGEPVMQMTMNTFHSGGTGSNATLGLPRIEQILNLSKDHTNPAVLAKNTGTVTNIEQDASKPFDVVYIGQAPHEIPHTSENKSKGLRVKIGDTVTKGDFLTVGDVHDLSVAKDDTADNLIMTNADPKQLFKLKAEGTNNEEALDYLKDYLSTGIEYTFNKTVGNGSIDRKHVETIVGKLGSKGMITHPGDSHYLRGQDIDVNEVRQWNEQNSKPIKVSLTVPANSIGRKAAQNYVDKQGRVILKNNDVVTEDAVGQLLLNGVKDIKVIPNAVQYNPEISSNGTVGAKGHENWLSNMSMKDVMNYSSRGAATGQTDKLSDPRTRLMTGKLLGVGEGYDLTKNQKTKDMTNSISNKMLNFFTNLKK